MSFHVGQQVVCVNDKFSSDKRWRQTVRTFPILNTAYTIREIHIDGPLVGFCLYQIVNPRTWFAAGLGEPAFNSRNFRPVKTTNIEVFEKLLIPTGEKTPHDLVDASCRCMAVPLVFAQSLSVADPALPGFGPL